MTNKKKTLRKQVNVSEGLANWYEEKAAELGVSQSSLMAMALSMYKTQQDALDISKQIPEWLSKVQEIQAFELEKE